MTEDMSATEGIGEGQLTALVPVVVGRLPDMLDDIARVFEPEWPEYAQFLIAGRSEVMAPASAALGRLVTLAPRTGVEGPRTPAPVPSVGQSLFEELGASQWREGRDLGSLLSAYRVAARVAWRHVSRAAIDTGTSPDVLTMLAEAVFVYVDQLCTWTTHGFLVEQAEGGFARERLREELAELLLSDRSSTTTVHAAAARAGWALPESAAVVFIDEDNAFSHTALSHLDPACLRVRWAGLVGVILPHPPPQGRRQVLTATLRDARAVVGPSATLAQLPVSARICETAAQLRRRGVLDADPLFVDEHFDTIIVHQNEGLLRALHRQSLAPLDDCTPATRARLTQTLASWLRFSGDRRAVAADLHVHPQTVRYRLGQLYELFGPTLDDPDTRKRLTLALGWGPPAAAPERVEPVHAATVRRDR
jgi:hypothetical protein